MAEFEGPVQAMNGLADFLDDRTEAVPNDLREKLKEASRERSPVAGSATLTETVLARPDDCGPILLDLAAATAIMMASHGFTTKQDEPDRQLRIAGALRRRAGNLPKGVAAQKEELDPEPLPAYLPEAEAAEAAAANAPPPAGAAAAKD